jgi:hypothetical protein
MGHAAISKHSEDRWAGFLLSEDEIANVEKERLQWLLWWWKC